MAAYSDVFIPAECSSADGLAAVIASCSPLAPFPGMEEGPGANCLKRPLYPVFEASEEEDNLCDESASHHVEKKRRLSVEQVKALEKNFEIENKLEPERKIQLAKELGLQPRQVAVWFQNRRARWKTKQLEKDYDVLKSEYDDLKSNYMDLVKDKDRLEAELSSLRERLCLDEAELGTSCYNSDSIDRPQYNLNTKVKLEENEAAIPNYSRVSDTNMTAAVAAGLMICEEVDNELTTKSHQALETQKTTTDSNFNFTCKKEGSLSSDSDASEILEADSPQQCPRFLDQAVAAAAHLHQHQQQQQQQQQQIGGLLYFNTAAPDDSLCKGFSGFLPVPYQRCLAMKAEEDDRLQDEEQQQQQQQQQDHVAHQNLEEQGVFTWAWDWA